MIDKKTAQLGAIVVTSCVLSILSDSPSRAEDRAPEKATLEVVYMPFPPYYETVDGEAKGILIEEVLKPVLAEAGFSYTFREYPVKRMYRRLERGESDIALLTKGSKVQDFVYFGSHKVLDVTLSLFHKKGTRKLSGVEGLKGKDVVLLRGYMYSGLRAYCEDPKNDITVQEVNTHKSGLRMVLAGRATYFMDFPIALDSVAKKLHVEDELDSSVLFSTGGYFLVSKKTPNAGEILAKLEEAFRTKVEPDLRKRLGLDK